MKKFLQLLSFLALLAPLSYADDLTNGLNAYEKSDYDNAVTFFQSACEADNAEV